MNTYYSDSYHLRFDDVEALVQTLGIRLAIALIILIASVIALVMVIRKKPGKGGK